MDMAEPTSLNGGVEPGAGQCSGRQVAYIFIFRYGEGTQFVNFFFVFLRHKGQRQRRRQ